MAKKYVRGDVETRRAMRELANYVATPANEAARKSLRPTLRAAKSNAPVGEGDLKKSLTVKRDARRSTKLKPKFRVGPDAGYVGADGSKPVKYAHLTEFGRAANASGLGGYEGKRWLTAAYESTKQQVVQIFGKEIGPAIEKRAAKLAAKGKR